MPIDGVSSSPTNLVKELEVNAFMGTKEDQTLATDAKPVGQPQDNSTNTDNSTNPS